MTIRLWGRAIDIQAIARDLLALGVFALPLVVAVWLPDPWVVPKSVAMLGLSIALSACLVLVAASRGPRVPMLADLAGLSGAAKILLLYLALTTLATIVSADPLRSVVGHQEVYQGLAAAIAYAIAFAGAVVALRDPARLLGVVKAAVAAAAIVAAYGILQQMGIDPLWRGLYNGMIFSTFGEHTSLGAYFALTLPLAAALALTGNRLTRMAAAIAAVLIVIALALAFSRGAYLGAAVAAIVFVVAVLRRGSLNTRRVAVAAAVAIVIGVIVLASPLADMASRVTDRAVSTADLSDLSIAIHLDLWRVGAQMAIDHPLLGIGPEMFPLVFPEYRDRMLSPEMVAFLRPYVAESPHDVPLAIAIGAGLTALAAYLVFVGASMLSGFRALAHATDSNRLVIAGLLAAAAAHFVTDLFMTADVSGTWIFWVILGALVATRAWPGREAAESSVGLSGPK